MKYLVAASFVFLTALAGCQTAPKAVVAEPTEPMDVAIPVDSFTNVWRADLELKGEHLVKMYLRDDTVFLYTNVNRVYVLKRSSGELLHAENVISSHDQLRPPVVLQDRIVYPTNTTLEIYNKRGTFIRSIRLPFSIRSAAVGSGHQVFMGVDNPGGGRFACINLDRMYVPDRWQVMTYAGVLGAPSLYQGILYFGSQDDRVYAITTDREATWPLVPMPKTTTTGMPRRPADDIGSWPLDKFVFYTDGPIIADIVADEYGVYVASTDSKLYCLDRATGKIKWQYYAGTPLEQAPTVTGNSVYLTVPGVGMLALDKMTGQYNRAARWLVPDARQVLAEDDKRTYVRGSDNDLMALDKITGKLLFVSHRADLSVCDTNSKEDGITYAATPDGLVMSVRAVFKPGVVGELVRQGRASEPLALSR